jgi:hypothetical protein
MITIETKRGIITTETKPIIRNLVEALPDGQHIVSIYAVGSAISEASKIADWYNSMPIDFNDLDLLQKQMDSLAYYCFKYTAEMGLASLEKRTAQTAHAIGYVKSKMLLRASGENVTDAGAKAKIESANLMMDEAVAEAQYDIVQAQLRALSSIITAMTMRLSSLKKEREYSDRGNASNFPV